MILIGLGSNLPNPPFRSPREVLEAALGRFRAAGIKVIQRSRWYQSAPLPAAAQPWYVNAVVRVETCLPPVDLLAALHRIEAEFGRVRRGANAARTLDLDLLAYGKRINEPSTGTGGAASGELALPHPRMADRAFVLLPLAEVAPGWRHPATGQRVEDLIANLSKDQEIRLLD